MQEERGRNVLLGLFKKAECPRCQLVSSSGRRRENGGWLKYVSLICACKYHSGNGLWQKQEWNVLQHSQNRHCSSYKKECIFNEILIMGLCDIRLCILQPPALSHSVGLPQDPKAGMSSSFIRGKEFRRFFLVRGKVLGQFLCFLGYTSALYVVITAMAG